MPPGPQVWFLPPCPPPHPLLLRALSLSPLGFSSHGNHWRPHPIGLLIPEAPGLGACGSSPSPYHGAVCCWLLLLPPASEAPFSLPRSPQASPGAPKAPGPAASPDPLAGPKHSVAAERPVDVQVYLRDVPGGDQGLLLHFLWENRGGGAGIRDRPRPVTSCHVGQGALWSPWECVLPKPPSFLWDARDGGSPHRARGTFVRACTQLLWAGR